MTEAQAQRLNQVYQGTVIVAGIGLWLAAAVGCATAYALRDQLLLLTLVPLVIVTGMFPNTFPLPSGLNLTQEKITFTLSDAIVLFVACWRGPLPAIFIAGIEGFTTSRRTVKRLPSNLFSFGMMALVAGASSQTLEAVLRYGFHETSLARRFSFPAAIIALLVANLAHIVANNSLFSVFFALRQRTSVVRNWCQNILWLAPLALPTSAVASLMYITLQYDALIMTVIGAPLLVAIGLGHRRYRDSVQARIRLIEEAQAARITTLEKAHRETIEALAVAINAKDEVTHEHVLRVQIYAAGVARILGCDETEIEALRAGALLHDVGKIAVPDYILNKPGKLTAAEFDKMKLHTVVGAQILSRVEFPYPVVPVVRHHHERWDGKGYPDGLPGETIPLTARILSVVDCFDAVREDRQYRKGLTREEAINLIMQGSGTQYDPRVVGTFVTHLPEFEAEIVAHRDAPAPNYGIEQAEELSETARQVAPAAGLAEACAPPQGDTQISAEQQAALDALARALAAAAERDALCAAFVAQVRAVVPYETCALVIAAPASGDYSVAHAAGEHAALLAARRVVPGEGVTGWTLVNRRAFYNADPKLDLPPALGRHFAAYRTLAACPVLHDEELHGAFTLYSSTLTEYSGAQQRLLEEAARLLAAAFARCPPAAMAATGTETEAPARVLYAQRDAPLGGVVAESELTH